MRVSRWAAYAVCACTGFYLVLPVSLPVPGLVTVSALEAAAAGLLAATLTSANRAAFAAIGKSAAALAPLLVLTVWLLVTAALHPVQPARDVIFGLGLAAGALTALALTAALRVPAERRRAVRILLAVGALAIGFGLIEPYTVPAWDSFWRIFRPAADDPVLHTIEQGQFRVSGIFADQNHFASFLNLWFPLAALALVGAVGRRAIIGWTGLAIAAYVFAHTLTRSAPIATGSAAAVVAYCLMVGFLRSETGSSRRKKFPKAFWSSYGIALRVAKCILLAGAIVTWIGTGHLTPVVIASGIAWVCIGIVTSTDSRTRWRIYGSELNRAPAVGIAGALVCLSLPLLAMTEPSTNVRLQSSPASAVSWRRAVWKMAAGDVATAPVTGSGSHAFMVHLRTIPHGLMPGVSDAHQLHLSMAIAGGIPAVGLVVHLLVCLLRLSWWTAAGGAGARSRPLGIAMLWYWISFLPMTLVGQSLFPVNESLFFCMIAGLTVAPYAARSR